MKYELPIPLIHRPGKANYSAKAYGNLQWANKRRKAKKNTMEQNKLK